MYADVILRPEINVSERKYLKYTNKIMKEITVLEWENVQKIKLARFARSHIHRFLFILVSCQYVAYTYSAIP